MLFLYLGFLSILSRKNREKYIYSIFLEVVVLGSVSTLAIFESLILEPVELVTDSVPQWCLMAER